MDTKSLHCKHPKKMKSSKDKHEVFVLPPDLLKKLGISIGNLNVSQVIPTDAHVSPSTGIINNEHIENIPASYCDQKPSDTSILETASLMKKSVFLSPTFVPTIENVIPGEIEILNKKDSEDSFAVTDSVVPQSSVFISADSIVVTNSLSDYKDTQNECHKVDQAKMSYNTTLNAEHTSVSNNHHGYPSLSLKGNKIQVEDINMIFDDELESRVDNVSDGKNPLNNNSNVELTLSSIDKDSTCFSYNDADTDSPAPKSSKINIVSEETIPLSKLRELKRSQFSNLNNLTPVTVHTIIDTKINIENIKSGHQSTIEKTPTVPLKNTELLQSCLDVAKSGKKNTNKRNIKSMHSNEAFAVPGEIPLEVEEAASSKRLDNGSKLNLSEVKQKLKVISENRSLECESSDKDSKILNENNTNTAIGDCQINYHNSPLKDNNISAYFATVNGFDRHENAVAIDVDKSVMVYEYDNGQIDEHTEIKVDHNENRNCDEIEHQCNKDNTETPSALQKETGIEKNSIINENLKQNSFLILNSEQSGHSNNLDNGCSVEKFTENKMPPKNLEDKTLGHDKLASILNVTKKLSTNNTDIKVDKVKEIAAYLKKFSHIYTDKKKTKTALCNDINKTETINSDTNMIESKLCIQGVEKPGGNKVDRDHSGECKVLKTYTRRNPPKESKLFTHILYEIETYNTVDALDHELDAGSISKSCEMQEFCLCNDFGRLAYYDDSLSEHIHFRNHNTANCELDLIFSIYSDEANVYKNDTGLEQDEKTEEKVEAYNICWNIFRSEFSDGDNSDSELIGHNNEIDELKGGCSGDSPEVAELNNAAQKEYDIIVSKTHGQVHMKSNSKSDIILETIDHDMVDTAVSTNCDKIENIENLLNTKCNDNISSAVNTESGKHIDVVFSTLQPKLIPSSLSKPSDMSSVFDKVSNGREKTYQPKEFITNVKKISRNEEKLDSPQTTEKSPTKRSSSGNTAPASLKNKDEPSCKKNIKCGLCNNLFSRVDWEHHVASKHHLIAWKAGGFINLDDPNLINKLKERLKEAGALTCSICNLETKKFKRFIDHMKYCIQKKLSDTNKKTDKPARKSRISLDENVTCGVCEKAMPSSKWLEHIGRNHDYLARTHGKAALDLNNESEVWKHLQNIIRLNDCLTCFKCGLNRSRVKSYLAHIKSCDGTGVCLDESSTSGDLNSSSVPKDNVEVSDEVTTVKCGVCHVDVTNSEWIQHIAKEHNYLAWHDGDTPLNLDEEEDVWNHLQQFIRQNGGLICHKCGLTRKRVKLYLTHVETCDGTNSQVDNAQNNISLNTTTKSSEEWYDVPVTSEEKKIVKCGVCSQEVPILEWMQHIGKEHNYLAWQDGAPPLDLDDESAVKLHLLDTSRQSGGLKCNKCEKIMKYPKTYQHHLKECTGPTEPLDSSKDKLDVSTTSVLDLVSKKDEIVTCGVCASKIQCADWIKHIETTHQYLAWSDDQPPLDLNDAEMVQRHLHDVSKLLGGLVCMKCGLKRKYVKSYLLHVGSCVGKVNSSELSHASMSKDIVECGICAEKVEPKKWRNHAMKEHYNIAWAVGDHPIELNNPYAVESYLKEYAHAHNKLVCKVCGISRVSYVGFYAHIIICGKSEEETEMYKSVCDICHNKYLRIYKSQHMTMHREKEYAMERKLLVAKEKELKKEEPVEVIQTGRRKAAVKAKTVIEKYKDSLDDGNYHCSKCGFSSEIEKELSDHVCVEDKWGDATDSDESVKLENCSDDDSDESDIDSNVSDEEREAREEACIKKKRNPDNHSVKIPRLPYQINNISTYMKRSTEEFIETYLTDDDIFTQYHSCEIEEVPESEVVNYMPPIEESCKVRFDDTQDWMLFKRFESNRVKDTIVMFMGASIQSMSWAPVSHAAVSAHAQYVAAAAHRRADAPRHAWDATPREPGLIQIWDCGNLIASSPQFALGIAHDYGTVWAIDWCPSGARDECDYVPEPNKMHRLGLLAAACSNGSAYIFLVPYPSSITEKDKRFYKLKPVVELRLTSTENRKSYQATAIKWSMQKGHSHVVVGYADGTTAYYDLNGESPLLRTTEDNITIFYPYHDERVQNSCVEDLDMYPSGAGAAARAGGAVCAGGVGGAGAGPLQSHVVAPRVLYPPHWPAALLAGDDCLVNQSINELEWWGGGRRLGGARRAAGCAWCGRVAAAAPPLLRLLRLHPCFADIHKQVIGKIQMVPLSGKRKRQNDELAMIVEPITYSDAIKKYGIQYSQITARDRTTQQKLSATPRDVYPERYPLSDVAAMQFCPTFKHHHKLALAMHAGIVFIVNV